VGVDINSASTSLLSFVAGIGEKIAQNIIAHKKENGNFKSKEELLHVKGLGKKAYEQAAGFIRIKDTSNPLQNSGIHPESFETAKKLLSMDLDTIDVQILSKELHVGVETLKDIVFELKKPGFDPRAELPAIPFKEGLNDISMLHVGSFISGIVRNITDFGAFVDVGLKNDALIHISKMSQKRISHPLEVLALNEYLPKLEVIEIDKEKNRLSLSLI
ncbi:helix-hairpin-helix domain-containing protein, partial [bacterium]|nr:helix-hairpin-helix domain-containing protein [bacterium]MBU1884358.1 helix-hairpin-helix domain-containing protein [bacterium]